ncbi:beta-glucan synthesis-associated protein-domain-containing protein [Rhodotorula diobovata]|uniref:Beta-glucan synthesis-associated protein-domain-containing protein n=1 Tax=Rhodotorula diobovata TaxID=5288 RepID=A0A5C5G2E5_9BASI|nr:beta-glucan synthesis-associated protein-domain-containing protein [Rhodotorula diobovata]
MSRPILTLNQSGYVNLDDPAAPSTPQNLSPSLPSGQFGARTPPGSPYLAGAFASSSNSLLPPPSPRTPQEFAEGVARGEIGADYGRYAPSPHSSPRTSPRGSPAPSIRGRGWERNPFDDGASFRSGSPGRVAAFAAHVERPRLSEESSGPQPDRSTFTPMFGSTAPYSAKEQALDDALHTYSPADKLVGGGGWRAFSLRGWLNFLALVAIAGGLVAVFAGYPIADWAIKRSSSGYNAFSLGGAVMNGTGQVPVIPNLPGLIDADTPEEAMTKIGNDGHQYQLVFSDEFNVDGRTFWPGDDPYWEAVDLHYWQTEDLEWYDPDAATTKDGSLVITLDETPTNGMSYRSAMLQSWNKFCFTGGIIEVSISLPGQNNVSGFWPGAWTMGNLARAGYGATTDGTWPYAYNTCDIGTLPNQTYIDGSGPPAALNTSAGLPLSYQPGQRLSSCTCSGDKDEHPGPNVNVGRGAPEIDIIEAQTYWTGKKLVGAVSQSAQYAPYDADYVIRNSTPWVQIYDDDKTLLNEYTGAVFQQACSGITFTDPDAYEESEGTFSTYGFEYKPSDGDDGYVTWLSDGEPAWTLTSGAVAANAESDIGQRTISTEPMSIILNLGISDSFQTINYKQLEFPGVMRVDWVRVYQREDAVNVGCSPKDMPTADYIANHYNAYTNPNLTTWEQAGYEFPRNSLKDTC